MLRTSSKISLISHLKFWKAGHCNSYLLCYRTWPENTKKWIISKNFYHIKRKFSPWKRNFVTERDFWILIVAEKLIPGQYWKPRFPSTGGLWSPLMSEDSRKKILREHLNSIIQLKLGEDTNIFNEIYLSW